MIGSVVINLGSAQKLELAQAENSIFFLSVILFNLEIARVHGGQHVHDQTYIQAAYIL